MINCAAPRSSLPATVEPWIQRKDSFSSILRDRRAAVSSVGRVQMCACTTPSTASLSTSTATIAWQKKPGVFPSPAGPRPLRPRDRPLKLISVVSWAATIRRPQDDATVRLAAEFKISCGVTCGESRKRCTAISPARSPPTWRKTNDPVSTTRSNKVAPARSRRTSPKKPIRNSLSLPIPAPSCRPDGQRITP